MLIYPAIDLREGRCVRLKQGRFEDCTIYDDDPSARLAYFVAEGAEWAHIVDLDGAKAAAPVQYAQISALAAEHPIRIQAGGGVRARDDIARLLDGGAARVVIGSAAVQKPEQVKTWIAEFGVERICLALDVKTERDQRVVAVHGWTQSSGITLEDALALYPSGTARHLLITDVSRDGMMLGPDVKLMRAVSAARSDLQIQASGGIAAVADLVRLKEAGAAGAIVGRALFEGAFGLKEALHAG